MNQLAPLLQQKTALIVSLPANSLELFQAAVEGGADAIKLHFNIEHRASGTSFGPTTEYTDLLAEMRERFDGSIGAVVGDSLQKVTKEEVDRLIASGIDFISLYAHHAPGWLLSDQRIYKMLAVNGDYSESAVSAFRTLPIEMLEASIIPAQEYGDPLSIKDLLNYRWLVDRSGKPVIVPSQRDLQVEELEALQLAGVKGIMIGAIVTGTDGPSIFDATRRFRRELDRLAE
ncbi:hypothetical protein [Paenibacillus sp. J2TS4]|uniref:hypothetical protein n=1 Tax=Paenibacillus sp. J2TS4 TaxID=2807194 RepID=UPI001B21222D|nr:hypothetical protein [Paenibacillus sp. J2TS4]GIP32229.1 hypothetical protein J2TS4_14390 [Paenibacillus sp. J2TS4]